MDFLHIKLFKYLISKDGAFGYVEIKPFLLEHFAETENNTDRIRMKKFLEFMNSEKYIEKKPNAQKGIWIISENGKLVDRNEISSVIRIKPKAVELYKKYKNDKLKNLSIKAGFIISILVLLFNLFKYFNKKPYITEKQVPQKQILQQSNHHQDLDSLIVKP